MKSPAPPTVRDKQREETREQILRAVARQLDNGQMDDLSFAEVAKDAGVGERTVYRYFPTKEALLGAFWSWMQAQAVATPERPRQARSLPRIREAIAATRDTHRPMRILLATDAWEPQVNGVVRTLTRVTAELRAMGHTVEVVSPDQFKTFPLPTYAEIKVAIGVYEPVQERFKAFEPEAIHIATEGPIGLAARRICVEWKLPFTTSYHTRFPEYVSARLPLPLAAGYAYMKWFHKPSGRLMVATPTMRDELTGHGFRNISSWSRGVDTEAFHPRGPSDPDVFEGLARPVFLYVGRVAVEKNIEAFLGLDLPGTKVVVGPGPQLEELKAKYPTTVFVGSKSGEELSAHYACADVFVFPSLTDTFGLVILEAMASGTPVAAYPAPGPIDIIPGSGAGALAASATEGLREACLDCLKLDRKQVRAFAEKFSWRACAEDFVRNLQPYPEPEKTRFWRRLRRLARVRRRRPEAA
ncbi:glycosyltransferase family 1 protein [Phenylobacterium hankyongense]|uniref:Glycosyltransferase family 1 protein n=2 Tax=Phenylobacterium hankyongense TaxID=1813876 RepID=A0A328AYH3_9CAUL|nr:glycosyltransferase family 1 protein [Phenylobacterium hankyongense]